MEVFVFDNMVIVWIMPSVASHYKLRWMGGIEDRRVVRGKSERVQGGGGGGGG